MARLIGAQRLILQTISGQADIHGFVDEMQLAEATQIALIDIKDWLETLESEEYVDVVRTETGLRASIKAKGRLVLSKYRPIPSNRLDSPVLESPASSLSTTNPDGLARIPGIIHDMGYIWREMT